MLSGMEKSPENHWRIPAAEQLPAHSRDEILGKIATALTATERLAMDPCQRGSGVDPYDSRPRRGPGDVWGQRRRA
jgi:hypothetical protein